MTAHPTSAPAHDDHAPTAVPAAPQAAPSSAPTVVEASHAPQGVEAMTPAVKAACLSTLRGKVEAAQALDGAANLTDRHHVSTAASLLTPGILDAGVSASMGAYATWKALSSGARLSTVAKTALAGAAHTVASFIPVGSTIYKATMKPISSSAQRLWTEAENYGTEIVANGVDHAAVQGVLTAGRQASETKSTKVSGAVTKAVTGVVGTEMGRDFLAAGLEHVADRTNLPRHRHVRTGARLAADGLNEVNRRTRAAHAAAHAHGGVHLPPLPAGWNYVPYPAGGAPAPHPAPAPAPHP